MTICLFEKSTHNIKYLWCNFLNWFALCLYNYTYYIYNLNCKHIIKHIINTVCRNIKHLNLQNKTSLAQHRRTATLHRLRLIKMYIHAQNDIINNKKILI